MKKLPPDELIARRRARAKAFRQSPEGRAWWASYRSTPEFKAAVKKRRRKYYENGGKEKILAYNRAYLADPVKKAAAKAYSAEYRKRPEVEAAHWRSNILKKYGITEEIFDGLFSRQNGKCALCDSDFKQGRRPYIDHDHKTGRVRGLLHRNCNLALGLFQDNAATLARGINYLRQ